MPSEHEGAESASPPRLLTPEEAQAALGVSPRTLLRYVDRGWLAPHRTPGGHRRYAAADVERLRVDGPPDGGRAPSPRPGSDVPAAASG